MAQKTLEKSSGNPSGPWPICGIPSGPWPMRRLDHFTWFHDSQKKISTDLTFFHSSKNVYLMWRPIFLTSFYACSCDVGTFKDLKKIFHREYFGNSALSENLVTSTPLMSVFCRFFPMRGVAEISSIEIFFESRAGVYTQEAQR